ncbi:MAG TPA: RimK family alpha-L-glutamate ligase, partial [Clostridiaceae bacterium]|nr:RimK family alpha-L-glutamate ligase [Clostridiaceae bacterium]
MSNKYGWLIYNGSLISNKFTEINNRYKESAKKKGIDLDLIKNNEIYSLVENGSTAIKMDSDKL